MKKIISMLLVVTAFTPVLSATAAPRRVAPKPLPCRHQQTVSTYSYSRYEQIRNNPNAHKETKYYNKQCKRCRKTIAKNVKGASHTEAHSFRGNKCTDCGAVKKVKPVKKQHVKPQPVKPQPVKPQPVKPQPVKPQPVKPQPVKPQPVKPQPAKDTTKPVVTVITSSKGTNFNMTNDTVKISAVATDNVKVTKMVCFLDGKQVSQASSDKLTVNLDGRKLTTGTHNIKVTAYDAAGNENSKTLTVNVKTNVRVNEKETPVYSKDNTHSKNNTTVTEKTPSKNNTTVTEKTPSKNNTTVTEKTPFGNKTTVTEKTNTTGKTTAPGRTNRSYGGTKTR